MTPYLPWAPEPGDGLRLFCFHHAGGAASAYAGWRDALGPGVSVLPVQLPGREARVREPRFTDIEPLVRDLDTHLDRYLRPPYAVYGHSMGALVAYALTRARVARGRPAPRCLAVGGYPAPHLPTALAGAVDLPDADLAGLLAELGGMSPALRDHPAWLTAAVALARDDLRACLSYRYPGGDPLPVPIHVFTGAADPIVRVADAAAWDGHTTAACRQHTVPGGHLFHRQAPPFLLNRLAELLTPSATSVALGRA
ncbi:thioesterase II family protein [Micromonospora sp. CPCC 206061]|uniref:thioesterase II family protein n=1 Tax=Micromonospora sp. CPCC 206061 TaxID=3122410 RepID=UPI002FF02CD9